MTETAQWLWLGGSLRGPSHHLSAGVNQDAWLARRVSGATVVVDCDGLGSRQFSQLGAKAACRAVITATKLWADRPRAPVELLLRLIHDVWLLMIHPHAKDSCASTCLLAVAGTDKRLLAAKLGDGMLAIESKRYGFVSLGGHADGSFSNQTTGLGIATSLGDWQWMILEDASPADCVMLATDGVSEDLIPEKQQSFLHYSMETYRTVPRGRGRQRLLRDMGNWPVPLHGDDKTMILMWNEAR